MSQTVIEVSGLKKQYRSSVGRSRITALDGIDFSVREGELFGLLGPNGAGKTTAVKILLDLTRATAGEARLSGLAGRRSREPPPRRLPARGAQDPRLSDGAAGAGDLRKDVRDGRRRDQDADRSSCWRSCASRNGSTSASRSTRKG